MTAQSIVCGACKTSVPYGRLSCPNCGELLASVAGARRAPAAAAAPADTALPDVLYDVTAAPSRDVVQGELAMDRAPRASVADAPAAVAEPQPPKSRGRGRSRATRDHRQNEAAESGGLDALITGVEEDVEATTTGGHAWAIAGASLTGPATPAYMPRPDYARRQAAAAAAAATAAPTAAVAPVAPGADPYAVAAPSSYVEQPGAYVPPLPAVAVPAGPAGPARAWAGQGDDRASAEGGPPAGGVLGGGAGIDPSRLAEFVGSVSVAGAALAAVGFLLPWAGVMIGSSGTGYFDRWGLAGPAHILVVIAILTVLVLSIVRNPIPSWIRTGIAGLGVGALLLGLTWPYLLGPLDAAPGVLIDAIGALALIGSGILALVTARHAEVDQTV